jgi:hypothetical protein
LQLGRDGRGKIAWVAPQRLAKRHRAIALHITQLGARGTNCASTFDW